MKKANTFMVTLVLSFISLILYAQDTPEQEILQDLNEKSAASTKAPSATNTWTGAANNYWGNPGNWSLGHAPTPSEDAVVPNVNMPCIVDYTDKNCLNLTINSGAAVTINDQALNVYGDATVYGSVIMTNTVSLFVIDGDITWESGSSATMTASSTISIQGDWDFKAGANVQLTSGYVDFNGSSVSYIRSYEGNCLFNHIRNHKTSSTVAMSSLSTDNLHIAGNIYNYPNCTFGVFSNHSVILDGFFNNMDGHFHCVGTFVFNGDPSAVPIKPNTGDYFNNLTLNMTSSTLELDNTYSNELHINGDLTINSGILKSNSLDIYLKGDWTNDVGTGAFLPGYGTVYFTTDTKDQDVNGSTIFHNVVQNDHLYHLRFNDYNYMMNLILNGSCWAYDDMNITSVLDLSLDISKFSCGYGSNPTVNIALLKQGGSVVVAGATLNINDLNENAILGSYELASSGGEININNTGDYVDLNGELHIADGTMTVAGSLSWWPYSHDAVIEMSGGVLDFTECGISIANNSYSLTSNITGGIIRTAGGFSGNRADFTPTAGTFEFYGTNNVNLSQTNGCTLWNVRIDKAVKSSYPVSPKKVLPGGRTDNTFADGKANKAFISSNFTISDTLNIISGELDLNARELTVLRSCYVYGTLTMNNASDVLNIGSQVQDEIDFKNGSTGNIDEGNININYGWLITREGCSFNASTSNTIHFKGHYNANGLSNYEPSVTYGNIVINKTGGPFHLAYSATQPHVVNGTFTINPNNGVCVQNQTLILHGNLIEDATSELIASYLMKKAVSSESVSSGTSTGNKSKAGYIEIDNDFTLNGHLNVSDGEVICHGIFGTAAVSTIDIDGGSLIADKPYYSKAWQYLEGTLNMTDGLFEITYNSFRFTSASVNNISGGTLRCGTGFFAADGVFNPTGGTMEFTGTQFSHNIFFGIGNSFYNLTINFDNNNNTIIYVNYDIKVINDLLINSGHLECGYDINDNYIFIIGGTWTDLSGGFIPHHGTVVFDGANPSEITTDETFYNLVVDKSINAVNGLSINNGNTISVLNDLEITDGTLDMNPVSTLDVDGNIHIASGAGLNANNDLYLNIFAGGDFTDDNVTTSSGKGYFSGTETITFDGTNNQIITTSATEEHFGNLVIDKPSGEFKPNDNIYVVHDFTLQNGDWADNVNGLSHYFEEDFTINAGGYFSNASNKNTVNFISDKDANIHFASSGTSNGIFNAVVIDKSASKSFVPQGNEAEKVPNNPQDGGSPKSQSLTLGSNVFCGYDAGVTIQNATLDLNGHTFTSTGDLNINNNSNIIVGEGATLKVDQDNYLNINNGGTLTVSGSAANPATVTHYNPGYYEFHVNNGGTLSADYAVFEYMRTGGLNLEAGSTLDPSHAFNYCTFQNNLPYPYNYSIAFANDQTVTCPNVNFPDNPGYRNVWKNNDAGNVTFTGATGDYAGPEYEYDPYGRIHWEDIDVELELSAILEGAFNGTNMNTSLNTSGLIPLNQPFDSNPSADWYYTGSESVSSIPAGVVDWVLVQLRDASDVANADESTVVAQQAAFLLNDGSIVDLDGTSNIIFDNVDYSNKLYPVVFHRNHLGVISADRITKSAGIFTYDFISSGAAYSNTNDGEKNLGGGVWGMFSGDASGGGIINSYDLILWGNHAGQQGYQPGDFNLDSQTGNVDKNEFYIDNLGIESQIPKSKNNNND
jgi:hypothetical protein